MRQSMRVCGHETAALRSDLCAGDMFNPRLSPMLEQTGRFLNAWLVSQQRSLSMQHFNEVLGLPKCISHLLKAVHINHLGR